MKCLIFSDSHNNIFYMSKALSKHPDAEAVFFLGDGLSDASNLASGDKRFWIAVKGNCDFSGIFLNREALKTEEIILEGHKIIATHGDLFGVKYGLDKIKSLARIREADIVLFGHTHKRHEEYLSEDGIYLFNPGSISSDEYSYGILTLTDKSVLFSHGKF